MLNRESTVARGTRLRQGDGTVASGGASRIHMLIAAAGLAMAAGAALAQADETMTADDAATPAEAVQPSDGGETQVAENAAPQATAADGATRPVSEVVLEFFQDHPELPSPESVRAAEVTLTRTPTGWIQPLPDAPTRTFTLAEIPTLEEQRFHDSALTLLIQAIGQRLTELDLLGTYAEADPAQFDIEDGQIIDLREQGDTTLRIGITTGLVTQVRTSALGGRFDAEAGDQLINNEAHADIREASPVRPETVEGEDGERTERPALLRRDALTRHALFLSRHPGRRVDVSVAPSALEPGAVTVDYLVTENKPWFVYYQLSNTGTEATDEIQHRFGFVNNQLTDSDDVFSLEYVTNNFQGTNSLLGSYGRPIGFDGRLRGRVFGSWYEYDASAVGQPGADFEGDGYSVGAEVAANVLQLSDSFVDVFGGVRFDSINVDNELAAVEGEDEIVLGTAGVRFERALGVNRTFADAAFDWSIDGVDGDAVNTLGRAEADEDFVLFRASASQSIFLETLFEPDLAEAGSLANEVYLLGRVQTAFDNRLAPNYQQVAGGLYTVRGYEESIIAGDDAVFFTGEYRFHIPRSFEPSAEPAEVFGEPFRFAPQYRTGPTDWDLVAKAFIDVARVENSDKLDFERDETLVGAGFGFELAIQRNLTARVDFGWALEEITDETGQVLVDSGDSEIHFVLTLLY